VPLVKLLYPDVACAALGQAIDQAKRCVLESDRTLMLQADACSRNNNAVQTKYHCWIDERGTFNELSSRIARFLAIRHWSAEIGQARIRDSAPRLAMRTAAQPAQINNHRDQ
jgi:hypothetical protein